MTGFLALLDDVASIAKVAAASVDDVAGMAKVALSSVDDVGAQAAKAGGKAMGAAIDDTAVAPGYVRGFSANRELPIVGKIAIGSVRNKLVILLPIVLLLSQFAPQLIPPLLMLGGSYLAYEGAEKVSHSLRAEPVHEETVEQEPVDPATLEESKVAGAIKTDFILSAEIMILSLSTVDPQSSVLNKALVLSAVGLAITALVYGSVALIVKADDFGLHLVKRGRMASFGRWMVAVMPGFMKALTVVGTAAMLWVGGQIVLHGLSELGLPLVYDWIEALSTSVEASVPGIGGVLGWLVNALLSGVFGFALGMVLIPIAEYVINPVIGFFKRKG